MADPTSEAKGEALRLDFYRRLMLRFRGSVMTSDGGLLSCCGSRYSGGRPAMRT